MARFNEVAVRVSVDDGLGLHLADVPAHLAGEFADEFLAMHFNVQGVTDDDIDEARTVRVWNLDGREVDLFINLYTK